MNCPFSLTSILLLLLLSFVPSLHAQEEETRSIASGRNYLLAQQNADGSWSEAGATVGPTALAGLALLAGPLDDTKMTAIRRSADWILQQQRSNGQYGDNMVEHAAATLFLSQLAQNPGQNVPASDLLESLKESVAFLVETQNTRKRREVDRGGWHFQPTFDRSDVYYTGWQLLALAGAAQAGVPVEDNALQQAVEFVKRSRQREGYGSQPAFSEASARSYRGHTGVALVVGRLGARNPWELEEEEVLQWMEAVPPTWGGAQYRGHFFGMTFFQAQAYQHLGGDRWEVYRERVFPLFLREQRGDGRWEMVQAMGEGEATEGMEGPIGSTALAILALAVEERRLPIFWPREFLFGETLRN